MTTSPLELERHLSAAPEEVWRAWTEPAVMQQWYCPNPRWTLTASADVRVGGEWQVRMGDSFLVGGRYLTVARPRLLGFTWAWITQDAEPTPSTVEVELIPSRTGTRLMLHHGELPTRQEVETHALGWRRCLDRLAGLTIP